MAVIPIVLFHDRALLQDDKEWCYASECTIAWVDEDSLVDDNDEPIKQNKLDKTIIMSKENLFELIDKPQNPQGFFIT